MSVTVRAPGPGDGAGMARVWLMVREPGWTRLFIDTLLVDQAVWHEVAALSITGATGARTA
jgi:hypothetical protein